MNEQDYIDEIEHIKELQRRADARWETTEAEEAVQRVRELHNKTDENKCERCIAGYVGGYPYNYAYPCPTIRALDGE